MGPGWLAGGSEGVTEKGRKLWAPLPEERRGKPLPQKSDLCRRVKAQSQAEEGKWGPPFEV